MDSQTIMELECAETLNNLVGAAVAEHVIVGGSCDQRKFLWSSKLEDAMYLMDIIEGHIGQVGILRFGTDCPNIISQFASVGDEEVGQASVYTGSWMESLCKAFLLYENGYRGDFMHPEFERKKREAPKRVVQ